MTTYLAHILDAITKERRRQWEKYGDRCISGNIAQDTRLVILVEEVGEVARAIYGDGDLFDELVQVAACSIGWLETLVCTPTPQKDRFCPRHGRASRPIEVPGLPCDCESNGNGTGSASPK